MWCPLLLRLLWVAVCALLWWWVRRARGGAGSFSASFQEVGAAKDQRQGQESPKINSSDKPYTPNPETLYHLVKAQKNFTNPRREKDLEPYVA